MGLTWGFELSDVMAGAQIGDRCGLSCWRPAQRAPSGSGRGPRGTRKIMRAGPGPGLANACGQPRGTYIMLPGRPRATVAPGCDSQLAQFPAVRTRGSTAG